MTDAQKKKFYSERAKRAAATRAANKIAKKAEQNKACTAVPQDMQSKFMATLKEARANIVHAPDPEISELFTGLVEDTILFAPSQATSVGYKLVNIAAFRAAKNYVDSFTIRPFKADGEITDKQRALISSYLSIVEAAEGVYQYVLDAPVYFEIDRIESIVDKKIAEELIEKTYTEVEFVESSFNTRIRIEGKRKAVKDMTDEQHADWVTKQRKFETDKLKIRNLTLKGEAERANEIIANFGDDIQKRLTQGWKTALHGRAMDISEIAPGMFKSLCGSLRKVFDNESHYENSKGRMQWLGDRVYGELAGSISPSFKAEFTVELETIGVFLDERFDPTVKRIIEIVEEHKRSSENVKNDVVEDNDLNRKAGDGEEPDVTF